MFFAELENHQQNIRVVKIDMSELAIGASLSGAVGLSQSDN